MATLVRTIFVVVRIRLGAARKEPTTWFDDELRQPAAAPELAEALWRIALLGPDDRAGTWHLPGPESLSRYEIAQRVAVVLGLTASTINAERTPPFCEPAPPHRPRGRPSERLHQLVAVEGPVGKMAAVTPAVLLWDFGDTVVDERWMRRPPPQCPTWEAVWVDVMASHADDWNLGRVGADEIFGALAGRSGMTAASVTAHARHCCESLLFNQTAWRVASERRLPQALVTVNPDLFADFVVPAHGLDDVFDVIVMSFAEQTNDKACALRHRSGTPRLHWPRSDALLIDNRLDLVQAWKELGGAAYWFRGDQKLRRDLPTLRLPSGAS